MSYVARSLRLAEYQTLNSLVATISCLLKETTAMSKYEYLAHISEIATQIAQAKQVPAEYLQDVGIGASG